MKATTLDVYTMSPLAVASCLCYSQCMCIAEWSSNVGKSSARIIPHLSEPNHSGNHCPYFRDSLSQTLTPNPPVRFFLALWFLSLTFGVWRESFLSVHPCDFKTQNHLIKSKLRYISAACLIPSLRERGPLIWKFQNRKSLNNLVVPLNCVTEECKSVICGEKLFYLYGAMHCQQSIQNISPRRHGAKGRDTSKYQVWFILLLPLFSWITTARGNKG